jgi:hypothetical protein
MEHFNFISKAVFHSTHPPTNALNKIQYMAIVESAACFVTGVPSSGSYRTKQYKVTRIV